MLGARFGRRRDCTLSGTTVLGRFPDYITLAHKLGSRHFDVGSAAFHTMGPSAAWTANVHFLDLVRNAGDTFVFSIDPGLVRNGTLLHEIQHLRAHGVPVRLDRVAARRLA
jgi:hypothetical protein